MLFYRDVGIDLGTSTVLVYVKGKGIILQEPSVVAIEKNNGKVLSVGEEARKMLGRTPGNIVAIRPLKDGVISDYDITEKMLRYFLHKVTKTRLIFKSRVVICVPSAATEVEKRAVLDAAYEAGAKKTYLIEEPIAAAIGAGMKIAKPYGNMVVDIGGGTCDIAVISLGGSVVADSIKVAGDKFDEAIIRHMRKKHNLLIGERTAEDIKMQVGSAYPRKESASITITGRNLISGLPKTLTVTSEETIEALSEPVQEIIDAVHAVLERTPPELASDISERGIVMTGGGAMLYGLDQLLQERTKIRVYVAEDPVSCVAKGTGMALDNIDVYASLSAV